MPEGNKRQAAIIFVIAGIFLVGLLLVGLGIVKQQNNNVAPHQQTEQAHQPAKEETEKKEAEKQDQAEQKPPEHPAPVPQPTPQASSGSSSVPSVVPATGPAPTELPATGSDFDFAIGAILLTLAGFTALRFLQSRQALQPKL